MISQIELRGTGLRMGTTSVANLRNSGTVVGMGNEKPKVGAGFGRREEGAEVMPTIDGAKVAERATLSQRDFSSLIVGIHRKGFDSDGMPAKVYWPESASLEQGMKTVEEVKREAIEFSKLPENFGKRIYADFLEYYWVLENGKVTEMPILQ